MCLFAMNLFCTNMTEIQISKNSVVPFGAVFNLSTPEFPPFSLCESANVSMCSASPETVKSECAILVLNWVILTEVK